MARRILKRRPLFFFRYRPPNEVTRGYLEGLLRDDHIWASPPREFSDWYDCRAQIDSAGTKAEWRRYYKHLFKTLGLRGKALEREISEAIAIGAWKDPTKQAEVGQGIQDTLNNSGVICLTDTALDKRMWDEYADDHRGICLCFESSEPPFSNTYDVNYLPEHPIVKFNADGEERVEAFVLTKVSSYSWEREWRFVDYNKSGGYKPISPSALRAIVLGRQTEAGVRQEIMSLVSRWKPDVMLFEVDALESQGGDLRLRPLDGTQGSTMSRIIPPIQERTPIEPVGTSDADRLFGYVGSVSPEYRRPDLDSRIESLVAKLKALESSQGRRSKEAVGGAVAAVREAASLLHDLVEKRLCGSRGLAPSLLPLLHSALRDTERCRELRLREAALQPDANYVQAWLHCFPFTTARLDLLHAVQHFLPDIALGLELCQCLPGELLTHFETPPAIA